MSGVAAAPHRYEPVAGAEEIIEAPPRDSAAVRLAVFAAFGLFGASFWSALIAEPQGLRALGETAVALAGGGALLLIPRLRLGRAGTHALAAVVTLLTLAAALAVAGLEPRLMLPGGWDELRDGLDRGLAGVNTVNWPYQGNEEWVRQTILLGAPLMLSVAAALAFWPAGPAAPGLRANALIVLLGLYGIAVTEHDPGRPLLLGFALFALVAAWLWLPRLAVREAAAGTVLVLAVGACALPLAASLDADQPWWDYRAWSWFGGGEAVTFDWNHSYGPLDWPREGTTLLNVRSDRPHYWKAEALDRFDGRRWMRSPGSQRTRGGEELPERLDPRWQERLRFSVRALSTDFVVGAGTPLDVTGAGPVSLSADGTTEHFGDPLERGDNYTMRTYAPNPTAREMRSADASRGQLDGFRYASTAARYTSITLPPPPAEGAFDAYGPVEVSAPLRGGLAAGTPGFERELLASPYERVYRLAQRVVAGAPTTYDAVKRVERHLQRYEYSERVPTHRYPLVGFLFEDRRGYCQQFAGAAGLMLRMAGIPTRVVSGFSPGSFNRDTSEYRVRDLDAHSWIEVLFPELGWVPFDPTPTAAPAESQSGSSLDSAATGDAGEARAAGGDAPSSDRASDEAAAPGGSDDGGVGLAEVAIALVLVSLLAAGGVLLIRARRRGSLPAEAVADAQLRELTQALPRLGWALPGGTTLLALERRLADAARPVAARYVARLRGHRFAAAGQDVPPGGDRRALRRELTAGGGVRRRLRGFVALPPWGPGIGAGRGGGASFLGRVNSRR